MLRSTSLCIRPDSGIPHLVISFESIHNFASSGSKHTYILSSHSSSFFCSHHPQCSTSSLHFHYIQRSYNQVTSIDQFLLTQSTLCSSLLSFSLSSLLLFLPLSQLSLPLSPSGLMGRTPSPSKAASKLTTLRSALAYPSLTVSTTISEVNATPTVPVARLSPSEHASIWES